MRPKVIGAALLLVIGALAPLAPPSGRAQQVIDRIVVRIEDDILTQSDLDQLAAYQKLVSGRSDSDDRLTQELIEQWIVNSEAQAAHFPAAPETEVASNVAGIEHKFPTTDAYLARLAELGLSTDDVHQMVARQAYLERYLDSKFRDAAQIDPKDIEKYYNEQLVPELQKQGQSAPPIGEVRDHIRELLTEQAINRMADQWLDESKDRLRIEIVPPPGAEPDSTAPPQSSGAPK
ncbi:MAG: hypothetical protein WBF35_07625 [Candidatus Acidiferrales bacterium]